MDTNVSPRIRVLALAGLIAAVGLAASMFLLQRTPDEPAPAVPALRTPVEELTAGVKAAPAAQPAASTKATPKPATRAKATPRPKPKPQPVVAANGLPTAIARELGKHRLVVAALYASDAPIDTLARDEARAGARDAKAGFAAVDVSDKRVALALASRTDSLSAPALLVFDRAGKVVARLAGFADRTLVAGLASSTR